MKVSPTRIPDVLIIEPKVYGDDRGYFSESFNRKAFNEASGLDVNFVQDNHSKSAKNVLRGLHYQLPPHEQGKLVRVVQGEVFDVAVDIRKGSASFGHWVGTTLSAENKKQMWIPPGLAHGFLMLPILLNFCTRPPTITYPVLSGAFFGTIRRSGLNGRLTAAQFFRTRMGRRYCSR
jgi:dTDP-4-dehydrorhamnose 3,5-epimerase